MKQLKKYTSIMGIFLIVLLFGEAFGASAVLTKPLVINPVEFYAPSSVQVGSRFTVTVAYSGSFTSANGYIQKKVGGSWVNVQSFKMYSSPTMVSVPGSSTEGTFSYRAKIYVKGWLYSTERSVTFYAPKMSVVLDVPAISSMNEDILLKVTISGAGSFKSGGTHYIEYRPQGGTWTTIANLKPIKGTQEFSFPTPNKVGTYEYRASIEQNYQGRVYSSIKTLTVSTILVGMYDFLISQKEDTYITGTTINNRVAAKFYKHAHHHGRATRELVGYAGQGLVAQTEFMFKSLYSWSWAPGLYFQYPVGTKVYTFGLRVQSGGFIYVYVPGASYYTKRISSNTWYEFQIKIYKGDTPGLTYFSAYYRVSGTETWLTLREKISFSVDIESADPILGIGTNRDSDYSSPGGIDHYYFASTTARMLDDFDGDGLTDEEEQIWRAFGIDISPTNPDSDGDGLKDGIELRQAYSYNILEINKTGSDAVNSVTKQLPFKIDPTMVGSWAYSNPTVADTDGDGLSDREEFIIGSSPASKDTDGDGILDSSDNAPLIYDSQGPALVNISGQSFDFGDVVITVPSDPNGVYFYSETIGNKIYFVAVYQDPRGIDKIHIRQINGNFSSTSNYGDTTDPVPVLLVLEKPKLFSYNVSIKAYDIYNGYEYINSEINIRVDSLFSELINTAADLITAGVDWVVTQVFSLGEWVMDMSENAINTVKTWVEGYIDTALESLKSLTQTLMEPITDTMLSLIMSLQKAINSYQPGTLDTFIQNQFKPLIDTLDMIGNLLADYSDIINLLNTGLDLALNLNPVGLATTALSFAATTAMSATELANLFDSDQLTNNAIDYFSFLTLTLIDSSGADSRFPLPLFPVNRDKLDQLLNDIYKTVIAPVGGALQTLWDNLTKDPVGTLGSALTVSQLIILFISMAEILKKEYKKTRDVSEYIGLVLSGSGLFFSLLSESPEAKNDEKQQKIYTALGFSISTFSMHYSIFSIFYKIADKKPITKLEWIGTGVSILSQLVSMLKLMNIPASQQN